jgi:hypothetical protein
MSEPFETQGQAKGPTPGFQDAKVAKRLAAADEVDYFVAVVGLDLGGGPLVAGEDFEVALDGHAAVVEAEFAQQINDRCAQLRGTGFTVY